jgi:methionyl aminopeptidase
VLNEKEQNAMRKVCRLAREVLDVAAREVRPGITTDYLDEIVHKACLERDVYLHTSVVHNQILTAFSHIRRP